MLRRVFSIAGPVARAWRSLPAAMNEPLVRRRGSDFCAIPSRGASSSSSAHVRHASGGVTGVACNAQWLDLFGVPRLDDTPGGTAAVTLLEARGSQLTYSPHFLRDSGFDPDDTHAQLLELPFEWTKYKCVTTGVEVTSPRKMLWLSDLDCEYRFAANHVPGLPAARLSLFPIVDALRGAIEAHTGRPFNSILINRYDSPAEFSAWHCDDDPWLGDASAVMVPSISLGEARRFSVRPKPIAVGPIAVHTTVDRQAEAELSVPLAHGSLALMTGRMQTEFQHALLASPDTASAGDGDLILHTTPRINLTFRFVIPELREIHNPKASWDA